MPISLVSKFSSLCEMSTSLPCITTELLMRALAHVEPPHGFAGATFKAWKTPSVPPTMSSRVPLTVATTGVA